MSLLTPSKLYHCCTVRGFNRAVGRQVGGIDPPGFIPVGRVFKAQESQFQICKGGTGPGLAVANGADALVK